MATFNTHVGDGTTVLFSFTFPYINESDVKVSLDDVDTTAYTFNNATTIQFTTAPAASVAIRIFRSTNNTDVKSAFFAGSSIKAKDLNDNFTQSLYVVQEAIGSAGDASTNALNAVTTANTALANSDAAVTTANSAVSTANTADTNASASVITANAANTTSNAASTTAANAVTTANTANTTAGNAVTTANGAVTTANSAATDAATAITTADGAVTTANAATATANAAQTSAASAVTTSNSAVTSASTANTTAGNAVTTANAASTTANTADANATNAVNVANAASAAISNAVAYTLISNVAAIPSSPSNNDYVEVGDSTGIQSFSPLSGLPSGFVGAAGLSVRLRYDSAASTWVYMSYFANDSESRYLTKNIPVVTGDATNGSGQITLNCENNSHGIKIKGPPHSAGANYTLTLPNDTGAQGQALTTNGSGVLSFATIDSAFIETPQTFTTSKVIAANINAGMMGPTVTINSGISITVGTNSYLTILK
jgi:hypothetical protein